MASGRGLGDRDIRRVESTIGAIKAEHPQVEVCVCLGLLKEGQAERLRYAYSHNLNTSEERYGEICTTHTWTGWIRYGGRRDGGLSPCSGTILGTGETDEEIVDLAFALQRLDPDSVPVNFLIPFAGTPLEGRWELTPERCLRILALFRFCFPDVEVRLAGGREIHLRGMQVLALHVAPASRWRAWRSRRRPRHGTIW
ncbi:hypothetical protein AB0L64_40295 [Kribbella sp. NPDC051936]|uniref:hypothetical protein n=1 Tax=Kribbella sp. NPDC051936 TaxID=3154946 RepID=UPI003424179A